MKITDIRATIVKGNFEWVLIKILTDNDEIYGLGESFMGPARYAYPVIIPTMLILDIGWLEIMNQIEQKLRVPRRYSLMVLMFLFVLLNILSVYSIYTFYFIF